MRRALVAGGLTALALAGAAAAGTAPPEDAPGVVVKDRREGRGKLDVVRAALGRAADGRLRASITMAGTWTAADLRTPDRPPGSVCVELWTRRTPGSQPPDYLVCATPRAEGEDLQASVQRERLNGRPRRVADADAARPTERTVTLRFGQGAVGRPPLLRVAFEAVTWPECPRPRGCVDRAPAAPRTVRLALRGDASG